MTVRCAWTEPPDEKGMARHRAAALLQRAWRGAQARALVRALRRALYGDDDGAGATVKVTVVSVAGLPRMDDARHGKCDPYVVVTIGGAPDDASHAASAHDGVAPPPPPLLKLAARRAARDGGEEAVAADAGASRPYSPTRFDAPGPNTFRTGVKELVFSAVYNESFELALPNDAAAPVTVEVWDHDVGSAHERVGFACVGVAPGDAAAADALDAGGIAHTLALRESAARPSAKR